MSATTRWWWIRHAPVTTDGGNIYGQVDVDADTTRAEPFAGLAAILPHDAVWLVTPLRRTAQTAEAIARAGLAVPEPEVEADFAEQHFGELQGRNREATVRANPDWRRFWLADVAHAPAGGESFVQLMDRVRAGVERRTARHAGRDIVAVAHGGSIRAAIGIALGLEPAQAVAFAVGNLSLTRLDHLRGPQGGEAWRVTAINVPPGGAMVA